MGCESGGAEEGCCSRKLAERLANRHRPPRQSQLFILSPRRFGVCYTFGNILCLGSMMFLMGPWNQVKNMFNKGRWIATLLYLGALVGTLYAAIGLRSTLLTMLFTILQFCALIWYSLSYIPFGQQLLSRLCGACFADE
uniref:Vesicle transport protein n=1 Tax=Tetraselmis sp. GSL018 TaxID=582737 RepID=A0A061RDE9_9CHLO|mmetsp:Transcript_19131/g.45616  ORF Transcript_19131/g.45616 Transcript_19131/m.45616 type:complete len:139 (+) Transcript_19131:1414-1830(+)